VLSEHVLETLKVSKTSPSTETRIIAATGVNPNVCTACGEEKLIVLIIPPTGPLSIKAKNDELIKLSRPPPTF
jgi:hypothetical protein